MEEASGSNGATRRAVLRRGLFIGFTAPALVSALQASTAWADDDNKQDGDDDADDDRRQRPPRPGRAEAFTSDLITVSQAASSDFSSGNPGSDPLTDGQIRLQRRRNSSTEGRVVVELRGAAPNAVYQVFFQPANGSARTDLGTIASTNSSGNVNARTSSELSGTNRIGIFVITRSSDGSGQAGKDEFVSSLGG
jgi:hypothetical protein